MVAWLMVIAAILVVIVIMTPFIFAYFYVRNLRYLGVDIVEILKNIKDRGRLNELVLERLGQLIGLALWRIYNNLKVFPADDQETRNALDALKDMSAKVLAVDWKKTVWRKAGDGPVILSGQIVLYLSRPKTDQEKKAAAAVREDANELRQLQRITGVMLVNSFFEMSVKIKLIEK